MTTLQGVMNRLSNAMQRSTRANDPRKSALIDELEAYLRKAATNLDIKYSKWEDVANRLKEQIIPLFSTPLPEEIPLKPEVFHGRDDLVQDIVRSLLQEETPHVCILGPGGMGKTSVALAVAESTLIRERFPGRNLVWVPCKEAKSPSHLLEILSIQLQLFGERQVTFQRIISELNSSTQPRLILLDNFETPWNRPGESQKEVTEILQKLAMLSHVAILVTMRGTYPPLDTIEWRSQMIQPIDEAASRRTFHDINPSSKDDPDVDRLLAAVGHMPLAVSLMANLGKRGESNAKKLLETWHTSGTDMLSVPGSSDRSMNRSISLSVDLVQSNPNALFLLVILSLLPAGTTQENLRWWLPALEVSPISPTITTLLRAALLVENKRECSTSPTLFVLPVIRSFMQKQHQAHSIMVRKGLHKACCEYVLAHACRVDDPAFPAISKVLAAEDTNIQSILFSSPTSHHSAPPSHATVKALIAFSWHRCDTKPSVEIASRVMTVAKASGVARYIASAVWCLGKTYFQLSDFHLSYEHLREAYGLFKGLPRQTSKVELQRLCRCGIDLVNAARFALPDIKKVVSLARKVKKKCAALSNDIIHGCSLLTLGVVLLQARQFRKALHYLSQATTVLKASGSNYNLAEAYQAISWVHYSQRKLLAALNAIQEAWKYAEMTDSPSAHTQISLDFGRILFSVNRDVEARKQIETALMKASYTGDRFNTARALEYMGYGYLRDGEYEKAHGAYKAAGETYLETIYAHDEKRCKDNMDRIKQKQGNGDMVIGFHRPLIDVDWDALFYPPAVQTSANDITISGS
ncbi:hypothetical protein M413DRAFT_404347 [Hebeloma cylindrosporum]|uniref:Novel STAND NTPase 1 domain-containing protein n=1 Tax=Hebeloma cylindrosporum TaxID=76867 RepID=A0A0C2Y101_HEBCY|nr:hypothetical protein M413DRAFT_404347 [Hebeloma cylindrosporum h7]